MWIIYIFTISYYLVYKIYYIFIFFPTCFLLNFVCMNYAETSISCQVKKRTYKIISRKSWNAYRIKFPKLKPSCYLAKLPHPEGRKKRHETCSWRSKVDGSSRFHEGEGSQPRYSMYISIISEIKTDNTTAWLNPLNYMVQDEV